MGTAPNAGEASATSARSVSLAAMFAATFLTSTSSIFIVTLLALHLYGLTGLQTLSALAPATQWIAAIPCSFVVNALGRVFTPARLMACMWTVMGITSLLSHAVTGVIWPLLALLCVRGGADFLAKNARAQWIKAAIEGLPNPQRVGSMIATSQYLGTLAGGLVALIAIGRCNIHLALDLDALGCVCAAVLTMVSSRNVGTCVGSAGRGGGTGWAPLFRVLGQRQDLGTTFVALIALTGLFQGYHQAAKIGLSAALAPLRADNVPGTLQAIAGLGIVLGAIAGGTQVLYTSSKWLAVCLVGAGLAMLCAAGLAGTATWAALTAYFCMMLLFEVGFTLASNQLLIALPKVHVAAMHSSSYVLSCVAMIATSLASAAAFERLPFAATAAVVILASSAIYASMAVAIRRKEAGVASPDVC